MHAGINISSKDINNRLDLVKNAVVHYLVDSLQLVFAKLVLDKVSHL